MSRDAKNSIFLWVGTLAFFGLFWVSLRFDIFPRIPDRWMGPAFGLTIAANVLGFVWSYVLKRKA
jgi:apolipoprotein N-acyltransferase